MARVLISMPERFLDEIDEVAENENRTRSELIREALRTYMTRNRVRNTQRALIIVKKSSWEGKIFRRLLWCKRYQSIRN